jgi:hypothetical protein
VEIQEDDVVASVAPEVGAMMRHRYPADPRINCGPNLSSDESLKIPEARAVFSRLEKTVPRS